MRRTIIIYSILIIVIVTASFLVSYSMTSNNTEETPFYVGVTFCGNNTAEAKLLIEKVKDYTNLFVLQSGAISDNETSITDICDYAVSSGLNIIVNLGVSQTYTRVWTWQLPWLESAKQRYGDRFLGAYYDDEPAGIQLDYNWFNFFLNYSSHFEGRPHASPLHQIFADLEDEMANIARPEPKDYDSEAEWFQMILETNQGHKSLRDAEIKTFTSDYALYWFDYLGGYDVMLAQFGWNNSYVQDIALVRGAARMQNKSWGAIITWKYEEPPYLDNGEEIYNQIYAAYEAGAEYAIIFTYPQIGDSPYGTRKKMSVLTLLSDCGAKWRIIRGKYLNVKRKPRLFCPETTAGECGILETGFGGSGDLTKNPRRYGKTPGNFWSSTACAWT